MRRRAARVLRIVLIGAMLTVAAAAFVVGPSEPVAACSCATFTQEEALANADAAFTATLVEVLTPPGDTYSSADPERFVFDVDEVFKGEVFARQSIVTARDGGSCGLEISGSGPFVVFARNDTDGVTSGAVDGELYSSLCSGTRPLASGALPADFTDASPPIPGASPIGDSDTQRPTLPTLAIAGAVAVLGTGAAYLLQRRRQSVLMNRSTSER